MQNFKKHAGDRFKMVIQEFIEGDASQLYEFQSYINDEGEATASNGYVCW